MSIDEIESSIDFFEALSPTAIEDVLAYRARPRALRPFEGLASAFLHVLTEHERDVFKRAYAAHVRAQAKTDDDA